MAKDYFYAVVDKTTNRQVNVFIDASDSHAVRTQLPQICGTEPGKIPYNDLQFLKFASVEFDTLKVEPIFPPQDVPLTSYDFAYKEVKKEEVDPSKLQNFDRFDEESDVSQENSSSKS